MITVTVAIIERVAPQFPMHIVKFPVDERVAWNYFHSDDDTLIRAVRALMGISSRVPILRGVYAEYLVDPRTGKRLYQDNGNDINDFLAAVYHRRAELLREEFDPRPKVHREFFFPVPV